MIKSIIQLKILNIILLFIKFIKVIYLWNIKYIHNIFFIFEGIYASIFKVCMAYKPLDI